MGLKFIEQKHYAKKIRRFRDLGFLGFRDLGFLGFRDLGFVKFQFPIIFFISFCNYSLFFLNLKYMLDIKGI